MVRSKRFLVNIFKFLSAFRDNHSRTMYCFIYNLTVVYFIKVIIIIIQCLLTIRNEYFYCTFLTVLQTVSFGEFLKTVRTWKINYSSCVSFSIVLSNFIGVYLFNNSVKFQIQSFRSYSKTNVARYWFKFVKYYKN